MRITQALNLLAKLLVKYDVDIDDPTFSQSDRELLLQSERDLAFYAPDLSSKRLLQRTARNAPAPQVGVGKVQAVKSKG